MFTNCKNTKAQGNIGLGEAIAYFLRQGITVSVPINDSQDYDLVADIDGLLSKIQVKTTKAREPSGSYRVELRNSGGTSGKVNSRVCESTNIDYLFVLTESNVRYLIPFIEVANNRNCIVVGNKFSEFIVT